MVDVEEDVDPAVSVLAQGARVEMAPLECVSASPSAGEGISHSSKPPSGIC